MTLSCYFIGGSRTDSTFYSVLEINVPSTPIFVLFIAFLLILLNRPVSILHQLSLDALKK